MIASRDSRAELEHKPRWRRTLDALDVEGDRTEARMLRRLQFAMAVLSVPMIGSLGGLFLTGGHITAALWPFGYCAATLVLLAAFLAIGDFRILRVPHLVVVFALPFGLHCWLGGYLQSGGALMWTLLVPMAATMFRGIKRALGWFLAAVAAAIVGYFVQHVSSDPLSAAEINLHFTFNTVGFTGFLFASTRFFVSRIDGEKARSDSLLRQIMPELIVRRLKRGEEVIADHVPGVTVVFADIVGFTPLAARLRPIELVALLDAIFRAFDALAAEHGVEKIKTIGDAYMAVAGAPKPCDDHAQRAARLAIAMRSSVERLAKERDTDLAIRIGMHSGEVVAGVIGTSRFAYDLWGDTVNTASRMESHGQPGRIQITAATKAALGGAFPISSRGEIEVKGRGIVETYWLD